MTETLTPSALRRLEEQQERNERILVELNKPQSTLERRFPADALTAPFVLVGVMDALKDLNHQGLLRRNGDVECIVQWLHDKAIELARKIDTAEPVEN